MTKYLFFLLILVSTLALWEVSTLIGERDGALDAAVVSEAKAESLRNTLKLSRALLTERDDLDSKNTKELADAREENNGLRLDVADGHRRLLIKADCRLPAATNPGAASVDDAGGAELAADARQDYYTLRDQLALSRQMIKGLQGYAASVCMKANNSTGGEHVTSN